MDSSDNSEYSSNSSSEEHRDLVEVAQGIKSTAGHFHAYVKAYFEELRHQIEHNARIRSDSFDNLLEKGYGLLIYNPEMYQEDPIIDESVMIIERSNLEIGKYIKRKSSVVFKRVYEVGEASVLNDIYGVVIECSRDHFAIQFNCKLKDLRKICEPAIKYNKSNLSRPTANMKERMYLPVLSYNKVVMDRCIEVKKYLENPYRFNKAINSIFQLLGDTDFWRKSYDTNDDDFEEEPYISECIKDLNIFQQEAVLNCLKCENFHLIHGPPGTGKTETIIALLRCLTKANKKVLVCSEQNKAVDLVLSKFSNTVEGKELGYTQIARTGNKYLIDENSWEYMFKFIEKPRVTARLDSQGVTRKPLPKEGSSHPLETSRVVFSTLCSTYAPLFHKLFQDNLFDYVIIDEAAMSSIPFTMMAMKFGKKVIFAGDHFQLGPVIKTRNEELKLSLFERIINKAASSTPAFEYPIASVLSRQYRMNSLICEASNEYLYGQKIEDHYDVSNRTLASIGIPDGDFLRSDCPINWITHIGKEQTEGDNTGFHNNVEATIVIILLRDLLGMGVKIKDIGIVCAYNQQKELIIKNFTQELKGGMDGIPQVSSVEGFQGGEKEVIIYCTTRGNKAGNIGFLAEDRKLNVAVTRAKSMLIVIANSSTLLKEEKSFHSILHSKIKNKGDLFEHRYHKNKLKCISRAGQVVLEPKTVISTKAKSRESKAQGT
jgi:DNA polymerase III delta prime subunit